MSNMSECEPITDKKNTATLQGGEKKVMKKIVSLALSTAMAFSMFASVTSAATLTTQEKYNALVTQGIFAGYPNGEAYLDKDMTRAEFAKVVALLTGLDTAATTTSTYADQNYANAWYKPYVEAVTKAGYMQGTTTGAKKLFNPNGKVTVQEMAATLVRAAKLEIPTTGIDNAASAWAKGEVQAAINAGLISKTSTFTAAATRGLLVDTAYAYQTALSKPAVASSEVTDNGATVIFTLANGEKVTVKPATALQPNVATTVTFKYNDFDYSESVTWKLSDATAVTSASASNLKEVTVVFNGEVDKTTAENPLNYSIADLTIDSASLSADNKTVTLSLDDASILSNNRATTLNVSNVKQKTGTTLISQSVSFTPADVTIPTISSVTALGTGAVEVKFSEPVKNLNNLANIQIDGRAIAANLEPSSSSVIITTPLAVGEHTIRISGVQDYSGLTMVPTETKFTVTADTSAPTIASATSYDLKEVTVTLSEPVRSITSAYVNTTQATVTRSGDKVTLTLPSNMSYSSNTVTLNGVTDYSGNTAATLTTTVTPTLDLTAPTVLGTSVGVANGNYYVDVQFSKAVAATDRSYYTLRDANGALVTAAGLTSEGHPVVTPEARNARTVRVTLGQTSVLTGSTYSLEIAGVRDTTVAQNVLAPYKTTLTLSQTAAPTLNRAWLANNWVYVEFSNTVSTTGATTALDASKYRLATVATPVSGADTTVLTDRNTDVEVVGANTVRVYARNFVKADGTLSATLTSNNIVASYVGDVNGKYFVTTGGGENGRVEARGAIAANSSSIDIANKTTLGVVTDRKLAVEFTTAVSGITNTSATLNVGGTPVKSTAAATSSDGKTVTFTFGSDLPLDFAEPANLSVAGVTDRYGNTVTATSANVANNIAPTAASSTIAAANVTRAGNVLTVDVPVTRAVTVNAAASAAQLFTAKIGTQASITANSVTAINSGKTLRVQFAIPASATVNANDALYVSFNGTNNVDGYLIATAAPSVAGRDALASFTVNGSLPAQAAADVTAPTVTKAEKSGNTIVLTFSESVTVPSTYAAAQQFQVTYDADTANPPVASTAKAVDLTVSADGLTVTLEFDGTVTLPTPGATTLLELDYTNSGTPTDNVKDAANNALANFTGKAVTVPTP